MRSDAESTVLAGAAAATLPAPASVSAVPARPAGKGLALDERRLVRSVNGLAIPIIAENLFQTMLGVVDLLMVSTLGAVAIAGVGTSLQIMFLVIAALSAVTVGTTVLVARFTGAGQPEEASRVAKQSLLMGVGLAAVITVLGHFFSHPIVALLGVEPDVAKAGGDYLDIVALTSVFLITQLICGGALRGAGDTRFPMLATGISVWLVRLPFGWLFGVPLGWGLSGVYISNVMDAGVRATANYLRYRSGRWRTTRV